MKRLSADERRKCEDKQWANVGKNDNDRFAKKPDSLVDPAEAAFFQAGLDARHAPKSIMPLNCGMPLSLGEGGSKMSKLLKKKRLAERDNRPAHSLKLGPLPCYLVPPTAVFGSDAAVKPFEDYRDKERDDEAFAKSYPPPPPAQ
jgi:hypothetical protein